MQRESLILCVHMCVGSREMCIKEDEGENQNINRLTGHSR